MYCRKCGKEIPDNVQFCSSCGEKCNMSNVQTSGKIKSLKRTLTFCIGITIILALTLGLIVFNRDVRNGVFGIEESITSKTEIRIDSRDEEIIKRAISDLKDTWINEYESNGWPKKIKIVNTQIIWIDDNEDETLEDVMCIVEFDLHTNYLSESDKYLHNWATKDTVNFYKDGTCETTNSILNVIRSKTYSNDYINYIEKIVDYENSFNKEIVFAK